MPTHSSSSPTLRAQENSYEQITQHIRLASIVVILVTLPFHQPQTLAILLLIGLAVIFTGIRRLPFLMHQRWFASRITLLIFDTLATGALVVLAGRTDIAYTGFFALSIITATYWYGLRGTFTVLIAQFLLLATAPHLYIFPPIAMDAVRAAVLASSVLLLFGVLLERLTHVERLERSTLEQVDGERQIEQERLFALVNTLNDATAVLDKDGRIILHNETFAELAPSKKDLNGQAIRDVLTLNHRVNGTLNWDKELTDVPQRHRDYVLTRAQSGETSDLDISITPVRLGILKHVNYIILCRDISNEKSLDEQREEFIAVASHELRTPLSIVEAALSIALLPQSKLSPETRVLIDQAHQNTIFLASLVKDLTTLSQAQNDAVQVELKPLDASVMLAHLKSDYEPQIVAKGLTLRVELKSKTPAVITTEHHVEEILRNFMTNALKYTQSGEIIIQAEPSSNGGVIFSVKDNGIGISKANQKLLFTKFFRVEDFRTRQTGGTGLGLYLCLELAERINGKVWCESVLNQGSTFSLEVPPFSRLERDQTEVVQAGVESLVDQV